MSEIPLYNEHQIEGIRNACKLASEVLIYLEDFVKPGVSTLELNDLAHKYITEVQQAIPAPLNYGGFPKSICTSINEVICHGIPNDRDILRNGDIINIDVTVIKDGFYGDTSKMFLIGEVSERRKLLCEATQESLYKAIEVCYPGNKLNAIGDAIASVVLPHHFSIVEDFIGHGIGTAFHTEPQVLHYPNRYDIELQAGMIFTIEPMINTGDRRSRVLKDGWTAITRDKQPSAQFEHQILITNDGCEVLTIRPEEEQKGRIKRHLKLI